MCQVTSELSGAPFFFGLKLKWQKLEFRLLLLSRLQRFLGSRGVVLAYADDIHVLGPPDVVSEALCALSASAPPPAPSLAAPPPIDCRSQAIGLVCAPGKTTVYGPSLAQGGAIRERAMAALDVIQRSQRQLSFFIIFSVLI